ncbi:MAG: formyltetrahydrofolate deformylase [Rikenellaceae bacterium]
MSNASPTAILMMHCPDRAGIISQTTELISKMGGNIIDLDQHADQESGQFFMRIEWELEGFAVERGNIARIIDKLFVKKFDLEYRLYFSDEVPRMAIFVSKMSHCLYDLLARYSIGEWKVEIPLIISNHPDMEGVAENFGIKYYHIPITKDNKAEQEAKTLEILAEHNIDFIVLARYMQIISDSFIEHYVDRIINIHHSFLPAFVGAKPYHAAHERGVKLIGATSHYVTAELDAGPIIEQNTARISTRDSVQNLVSKGRDLEKTVLSQAVEWHIRHRILTYGNKTMLFV